MNIFEFGKKFLRRFPNLQDVTAKVYSGFSFNKIRGRKGNKISFNKTFLKKCSISLNGSGNSITTGERCYLIGCKITVLGNNNSIILGDEVCLHNTELYIEDCNGQIIIGNNTLICGKTHLAVIEGTKITIGKDCLFSENIMFRTGDSHSVLDLNGNRINPSKDIVIGNHVWIGNGATVLKGAKLSDNSIVSTGAILTKEITQSNVTVAGVPAVIVKENINWCRERL